MRGQVYFKAQRLPEAEAEFKAAVAADPSWTEALFNLAVVFDAEGRLDVAVETLKEYLPTAAPSERDALRQRIAEMEVKLDDQRVAAAKAKAEADAERARAEAAQRQERAYLEAQRRAQEEAELRQRLEIHGPADSSGTGWMLVRVKSSTGVTASCPEPIHEPVSCSLHIPPGHATVTYQSRSPLEDPDGKSREEIGDGFWMPDGPERLDLRWRQTHGLGRLPIILAGTVAALGGLFGGEIALLKLTGSGQSTSPNAPAPDNTLPAVGVAVGAALLVGGGIAVLYGAMAPGGAMDASAEPSSAPGAGVDQGAPTTPKAVAAQ